MFNFKMSVFNIKRTEFCYAGEWLIDVDIETGNTTQCYCSRLNQNIYDDINKPIVFLPIGKHCSLEYCYNAHALMTLGMLPDVDTPTYYEMRNRKTIEGTDWITPEMEKVYKTKLVQANTKDTSLRRIKKQAQLQSWRVKNRLWKLLAKKP